MQVGTKKKVLTVVGVFAIILILGGCGRQNPRGMNMGAPEVAVVTVQPTRIVLSTELTGRTSANLVADVRPQVGGIVQKRLFIEGSDVKAGQVLYQIDPAPFQAALDNAKASLDRSEANLPAIRSKAERIRELLTVKAVSQQDCDDAQAALKQAEADVAYWKATVRTAQINLGYTRITAPISGRIGRSDVTEGALVTAQQPNALASIQQIDPVYVDVPQSTTQLLQIRQRLERGQLERGGKEASTVRLLLENDTLYDQEGKLQFRDVTVDPTTGSVILRIIFPNPKGVLLPGMFVRALVQEGVNSKAILIPHQAVSRNVKGEPLALIVDPKGQVQQRILKIDRSIGNAWLVSAGLAAGDRVIVEGLQQVKPGIPVKVVPFVAEENANGAKPATAARPAAQSK